MVTHGDIDRFTARPLDSFYQSGVVDGEQLAGCRTGLQTLSSRNATAGNAGQVVCSSHVGQSYDRPQQPDSVFTPEYLCSTVGLADQGSDVARFNIGKGMPVFIDADLADANAADPGPANPSVFERIEQDDELPSVGISRNDRVGRGLILELKSVGVRRNDGRINAEHRKAIEILTALIADLDDVALTRQQIRAAVLVVLALSVRPRSVDHRVPG